MPTPPPADDADRVSADAVLGPLDANQTTRLDRITRLAAMGLATPFAWVSWLSKDCECLVSRYGLSADSFPRRGSCADQVAASASVLAIEDAQRDARFSEHASVAGALALRSYAGYPIRSVNGHYVATLAVADTVPRRFDSAELTQLSDLAALVERELSFTELERASRELAALRLGDLSESEARHRAILEAAIDGIISIDEFGTIQAFNPAAERLFGYDQREVIGKNVSSLMPAPERDEHDAHLGAYRASGRSRPDVMGRERLGLRKSGEVFPLEIAVSEIRHGGRRLFTGIVRDLTERKKVERLKDEFVSTVSHELRTPLTSIRGALSLLLHGPGDALPETARTMLQIAFRNSERLVRLINDLLDVQKIESGALEFVLGRSALSALLEQALEANRSFARQLDVQLELGEVPRHVFIHVDADRMMQVLTNLLSNAAKFSHAGGTVTLAASQRAGRVRIDVTDRGPGVPLEFRDRIFQKFAQADGSDARRRGGTGLGLSIARALVEHMGGAIDFVSEIGHGTTFFVDLPVAGPPSLPPQALSPVDPEHR